MPPYTSTAPTKGSLCVGETLKGKNAFKKWAKQSGVDIAGYHAGNALFRAVEFVRDCNNKTKPWTIPVSVPIIKMALPKVLFRLFAHGLAPC
jgi:hypothetical protein